MDIDLENVAFGQADLTTCEREPIHIPASIQPNGCVMVFSKNGERLTRYSENVSQYLGLSDVRLGVSLTACFDATVAADILDLARQSASGKPAIRFDAELFSHVRKDIVVHYSGDELVLECEESTPTRLQADLLTRQRRIAESIRNPKDVTGLLQNVVPFLRRNFGYDRVMAYRFAPDWSGKVIAEDRREGLESFLGQHFPNGDIPRQARELYERSLIRVISDAAFNPVPLVQETGLPPLDMAYMHLRAVSPIHCEYLANMGVRASMSLSLIVDGVLWGLIAFHHYEVRQLTMAERITAKMVGEVISLQMVALTRTRRLILTENTHLFLSSFLRKATESGSFSAYLQNRIHELLEIIECDGGGIWLDGVWTSSRLTLDEACIGDLLTLVKQRGGHEIWVSDHLVRDCPSLEGRMSDIAGAMVIPVWPEGDDYLVIFRREIIQTVLWGGDPKKTYTTGPHGARLTPRRSFELWKEEVRAHCLEWTAEDMELASLLRTTLMEIMALSHQHKLQERIQSEALQRTLNDELNHRVKNILTIVQSIVARQPKDTDSVVDYSDALKGRIRSLANAHDQALAAKSGTTLRDLLEAELAPYDTGGKTIFLEGPPLVLTGQTPTFLALLLHELATNAAKYGAFSTGAGRLTVSWHHDKANDFWKILWSETGGSEISEPEQSGFGSLLLERAIHYNLGGRAVRKFLPEGIQVELSIPRENLEEKFSGFSKSEWQRNEMADPVLASDLSGRSLLILEDEFLIALDVEQALQEKTDMEVHSAASITEAVDLISRFAIDMAILDVNIAGETSLSIAESLSEKHIPFVFTTGCEKESAVIARFPNVPVLKKPYEIDDLLKCLSGLSVWPVEGFLSRQ